MILTDAGPLVALVDRGEPDHARCREAVQTLRGPMLTTWPAFTEAMHLLGDAGGWSAQNTLWRLIGRGDLVLDLPRRLERIAELMEKYRDTPMDIADASLIALAEERDLTLVFTLDDDFRVYRIGRGKAFTVVP